MNHLVNPYLLFSYGVDTYAHFIAPHLELHLAFGLGKKGVVLTHTYINTWIEFGAYLSYEDIAGNDVFSAELFDTTALPRTVQTVS